MSKQLKLRRGTTAQHSTFTGAEGEVTVDTTKDTLVVHDGVTAGGKPLATEAALAGKQPLSNNLTTYAATGIGFRNRIINGDMRIDQRNAGASVTLNNSTQYSIDRWYGIEDTDGGATLQRSTVAPTGFSNSLLYTVTNADASLGAVQYTLIAQAIEGFNVADLGWGTANAQAITISFWVRSSLTGTFGGALNNSASNRSYPFTYTISAANTWEQKSITIAGDTSGTWLSDNNRGITLNFGLGVGSTLSGSAGAWASANLVSATGATSVVGTNGATFYITGVQLEAGTVASPFERRDYGRELMMCQRYRQLINGSFMGLANNATSGEIDVPLLAVMRSAPTMTNAGNGTMVDGTTAASITDASLSNGFVSGPQRVNITSSGMTQSRVINAVGQTLLFTSEL